MKEILLLLVMFWNLENYFDPFPPYEIKFWSWKKFEKKRDDIAKTIMLAKEQYQCFPALIGVCEVENYFVLKQLTQNTPLHGVEYGIIHKDSPDKRGIDVALLYRKGVFTPVKTTFYPLFLSADKKDTLHTRLILYTKGVADNLDTIHILVNHWPSKLGGEKSSSSRRMIASGAVKAVTDSILNADPDANIIVMGDFNDTPHAPSLANLKSLRNLAREYLKANKGSGSHKFKAVWSLIDQFLVSERLYTHKTGMDIFAPPQLLVRDKIYFGYKVRRTMQGPKYLGGVSDHLPIVLKVLEQ